MTCNTAAIRRAVSSTVTMANLKGVTVSRAESGVPDRIGLAGLRLDSDSESVGACQSLTQ